MAQEIERKFLVKGGFKESVTKSTLIIQGYLSSVPGRTVRVRVNGDKGFITIKGRPSAGGLSRFEWEKEIPEEDAYLLLKLCGPDIISKTRHLVPVGGHIYEVDEFHGANEGLTVAEIELGAEDEAFMKPEWLGEEVTGDARYYNSMLIKNPYRNWQDAIPPECIK